MLAVPCSPCSCSQGSWGGQGRCPDGCFALCKGMTLIREPGDVGKDAPLLLLALWRSADVPDLVSMYGEGSEQKVWVWLKSDPCHCSCRRNLE